MTGPPNLGEAEPDPRGTIPPAAPHTAAPAPASPDHPSSVSPAMLVQDAAPAQPVVQSDAITGVTVLSSGAASPQPTVAATVPAITAPIDQSRLAPPTDHAPPANQIVPALVGVLQNPDGTPGVTVRLQPPELGHVQIRVDQTVAGATHVDITADRPETLQLLQRDEPKLQQALDQAGVQAGGRTFSFQVAASDQPGSSSFRPDNLAGSSSAFGQGQSGGAGGRQQAEHHGDFGQGPGTDRQQGRTRWFRAGLDITA